MSGSLWQIHVWEAVLVAASPFAGLLVAELLSGRARANRAKLRRRRHAEREMVRRLRAW